MAREQINQGIKGTIFSQKITTILKDHVINL